MLGFVYNFFVWFSTFPDPSEELCQEERILYKLISGLHSSISVHIAADYLLDEAKNLVQICFIFLIRLAILLITTDKFLPYHTHGY